MALLLVHQTQQEFIQRLVQAYRESIKERTILIARFILNKITNGDLTDNQVRNAFNLTTLQWTALKTKMQNWISNYDAAQTAQGE